MTTNIASRATKGGRSNAEKIAAREAAIEQIRDMLDGRVMSVSAIAADLGLSYGAAYSHLCFMAEMGEARRTGDKSAGKSDLWTLGRDDRDLDDSRLAPRHGAVVVPAQQVGMWRDPLDVALFGPARGVAA